MAKPQPHGGPWKAALQAGATRYYGRPCPQHPDLKGERFVQSCGCIGCVGSVSQHYEGRPCPKHPELKGLRTSSRQECAGCIEDQKTRRQLAAKLAFDQRSERDRITDQIEAEVAAARRESMRELRRESARRARLREEFAPLPRRD
jgi:hypothetical protein